MMCYCKVVLSLPALGQVPLLKSTMTPFSDKLMLYIISLLSTTPLSYSALGTSFSFRNDLSILLSLNAKELFSYAKEGAKLMIKHKWMEEPPHMEDRNQLIKNKQ